MRPMRPVFGSLCSSSDSAFADTLSTATAGQFLEGGAGNDIYIIGNQGVVVTEAAGGGDDEIRTALATYSMDGNSNVERLTFTGTGSTTLTGNADDNIITGGTGNDTLIGGAGADQLVGSAGTDYASYANGAAVTLNFKTWIHTGDAAGDSFGGIEGYIGSGNNDSFISGTEAAGVDPVSPDRRRLGLRTQPDELPRRAELQA